MIGTRHQIKLEQWKTTKDGNGNNIESVINSFNSWADIERQSGDRSSLNGRTALANVHRFRIRYASMNPLFITGNWRIIYDSKKFSINSVEKESEKRFYWIIKATAQGNV